MYVISPEPRILNYDTAGETFNIYVWDQVKLQNNALHWLSELASTVVTTVQGCQVSAAFTQDDSHDDVQCLQV